MNFLLQHVMILPLVTPLVAGALMLFLAESRRRARISLALGSVGVQLLCGITLLQLTGSEHSPWPGGVGVYSLGSWAAPFGIVLVADRLTAVLVTLSAVVSMATLVYLVARWDRPGQPLHSVFQFMTIGLNGAFLTGDLFNLFVFFEVMLAASYGMVLRGAGVERLSAGLHYITVNLVAALLFLVGVAIIYGITGTLNMAALSLAAAELEGADRSLFATGSALLAVAFLVKAGCWPLNLWLLRAYPAAAAPIAAGFALMTKVGVYAVLRMGTLLGELHVPGRPLFVIGLVTLVTGCVALLASRQLQRLVSCTVLVSSGLLLSAAGLGIPSLTGPLLFYLVVSVITTCAFFLVTGMTQQTRPGQEATQSEVALPPQAAPAPVVNVPEGSSFVAYGIKEFSVSPEDTPGVAMPAPMAFLGVMFVCCVLLVSGLPPLPTFFAKIDLLATALGGLSPGTPLPPAAVWTFIVAVLASGFVPVIALSRSGINLFWSPGARTTPRLQVVEAAPVAALVVLCLGLSVYSGPVGRYLDAAAQALHQPTGYIQAVLGLPPSATEVSP